MSKQKKMDTTTIPAPLLALPGLEFPRLDFSPPYEEEAASAG